MASKKGEKKRGINELNKELSDGMIRQLYLLYGSERFLIQDCKAKLLTALNCVGDEMNFNTFSGDKISIPELLDTAKTMPFFSERRVVLVEDSGFFKAATEGLLEGLEELPSTTVLIFIEHDKEKREGTEKGVDGRNRLFKYFDKAESAFIMEAPDGDELYTWITSTLSRGGKRVERGVPERLLSGPKRDMQELESEMEKLISYTLEKDQILVSDVEEICVSPVEDKIFDMIAALSVRDKQKAILYYTDLIFLREPVFRILAMIQRHYQILLKIKQMQKDHTPWGNMARQAGIQPFLVKKYLAQANGYSEKQLLDASSYCFDVNLAVTGGIYSEDIALDRLIIQLLTMERPE